MMAWTKVHPVRGGFEYIEHPIPIPKKGEVLVKTETTSICGTDLHIWEWDDWSAQNVPLGTITGHETCGKIVALGDDVTTHSIGDHVSVECHLACWKCDRCKEGDAHICENGSIFGVHRNGAFAPWFTIPAENARITPLNIERELASIQDPLGNAIHTLTGGPIEGATVAIYGLGPIGLFAVDVAKNLGAKKVIACDWDNDMRMKIAINLGADLVLGKNDDVLASILEVTGGKGVDNSCEFSGSEIALKNAIQGTRMGGYLNILGVYGNDPVVPINDVVFRYLHVKGINGRRMWGTWNLMQDLLSTRRLRPQEVITHRMPIEKFEVAIELMRSGNCGKIILEVS